MGIERSQIILEYKAEVHGAIASLRTLTGEQKRQARDAIAVMQDQIKAHERQASIDARLVAETIKAQENLRRKMEETTAAQAKAAKTASDSAAGWKGFARTVADVGGTINTARMAIKLGERAVEGFGAVVDAFNRRPPMRMQWDKKSTDDWVATAKMLREEAQKTWAAMMEVNLGVDVDSDRSRGRRTRARAEVVRKDQEETATLRYLSAARLEEQKAAIQDQKDRANREGRWARPKGGRRAAAPMADSFSGWDDIEGNIAWIADLAAEKVATMFGNDYLAAGGLAESAVGQFGRKGQGFSPRDQGPTFMERMLGPPEQFDVYATAWGTFESAVSSGYEALITGSESAGKAMKRIIGQSIMAEGSRMLIMALREGAMAVASLATQNYPAAAMHGKSALMFGAGAVAAGVAARARGAGGSSASAGAGASGVGAGGGSSDNAPRNTTIVLGHGWDDESPRQRAARLARANRKADGYEPRSRGVDYS